MKPCRSFIRFVSTFLLLQAVWFVIVWVGFCIGCGGIYFDSGIWWAVAMFYGISQSAMFFLLLQLASALIGQPVKTSPADSGSGVGYYAYHNFDGSTKDQPDFNDMNHWLDD